MRFALAQHHLRHALDVRAGDGFWGGIVGDQQAEGAALAFGEGGTVHAVEQHALAEDFGGDGLARKAVASDDHGALRGRQVEFGEEGTIGKGYTLRRYRREVLYDSKAGRFLLDRIRIEADQGEDKIVMEIVLEAR